jgi:hypothetical protein
MHTKEKGKKERKRERKEERKTDNLLETSRGNYICQLKQLDGRLY